MVVRFRVTTAAGRQSRAAARQRVGNLRDMRIAPATKVRYERAVEAFFEYMEREGLDLPQDAPAFDAALCEYIDSLWHNGDGVGLASNTLSGLQHEVPSLRRNLSGAWQFIGLWQRLELPVRSTPAWFELVAAMAGMALHEGDIGMAAGVLLGWECLLRTGEIGATTLGSVTILRGGTAAMVDLGWTKGALRKRVVEEVTARDSRCVALLLYLLQRRRPGELIVEGGTRAFATKFSQYLRRLGLEDIGLTPYCLRRGRATALWQETGSLARVQTAGRWANMRTARLYVDGAAAQLTQVRLPEAKHRLLRRWGLTLAKL
jgi:hypothetical protein